MPDEPNSDRPITIWDDPTGDRIEYLVITGNGSFTIGADSSFLGIAGTEDIKAVHLVEPTGCLAEVGIESAGHLEFEIYLDGDRDAVVEHLGFDGAGQITFDYVYIDGFPA